MRRRTSSHDPPDVTGSSVNRRLRAQRSRGPQRDASVRVGWLFDNGPSKRDAVLMRRKLTRTLLLSAALAAVASTAAQAAPTQLIVTNVAQSGLESELPQPPVSTTARGSCDTPFSAHEANTGVSPCAQGSWPAPDGNWAPEVAVAGGDRLTLSFDSPVD